MVVLYVIAREAAAVPAERQIPDENGRVDGLDNEHRNGHPNGNRNGHRHEPSEGRKDGGSVLGGSVLGGSVLAAGRLGCLICPGRSLLAAGITR